MTAIASTPAELLHAHVERGRALSAQGRDDDVIGTLQHALADDAAAGAGSVLKTLSPLANAATSAWVREPPTGVQRVPQLSTCWAMNR